MSDVSRSVYRGLLIQDPRITAASASGATGADTSSYTQAGQLPGVPVPGSSTDDLVLQTSGTPTDTTAAYVIRTKEAGFPGRDRAKHVWRRSADAVTAYYGWEHPNVPATYEPVVWTTGGATPYGNKQADAVTLSDGTVIVATHQSIDPATTSAVKIYVRNPTTHAWAAAVQIYDTSGNAALWPCLVVLPDDRVLCFFWIIDGTANTANIRAKVSADSGATWTTYADYVLEASISTSTYSLNDTFGRLKGCYLNGDILLTAFIATSAPVYSIRQWASHDLGGNFQLVEDSADKRQHDVTVSDGGILVAYFDNTTDGKINIKRLGSPYQPLNMSNTVSIDCSAAAPNIRFRSSSTGDIAIWTDDDGMVYLAAIDQDTGAGTANGEGLIWRSLDGGASFENVGESELGTTYGTWWRTEAAQPIIPKGLTATSAQGRQILFCNVTAPDADDTGDASLFAVYLGGYSTQTMPFLEMFKKRSQEVGFDEMWFGWGLPDSHSTWTVNGTAARRTNGGGYLSIATSADTCWFTSVPTTTAAQGLIAQWEMKVTVGGSLASNQVAVRLALQTSAGNDYEVLIRFTTTQFRIFDNLGGGTLATVTADMSTDWVQFRAYFSSAKFALYYRVGGPTADDRAWTLAHATVSLTAGTATPATDQVLFGNFAASTSTSLWRHFHWTDGANTGRITDIAQANGQTNPTDLNGKDYSATPYWLVDGHYLKAIDGPTAGTSTWTISPRYEYGINRILSTVEPSPSVGWRSTTTASDQSIAFKLQAQGNTEPLNQTIALYLEGINFRYCNLYKYSSAAHTLLGQFDAATGTSGLTYVNANGGVRAGPGTEVANRYYMFNELAGGTFVCDNGVRRRILGNTEGFWQGATSGVTKQVTLWLDGIDGTEDSSGTAGEIWYPRGVLIVHLSADQPQAYQIVIPAQTCVESYFTIGQKVLGPVVVFGKDYDWNRKLGLVPQTSLVTNDTGNRRSRRFARLRRTVELPWTGGVDLSKISGTAPSDDYIKGTTTAGHIPVALRNDTPLQLAGLMDYLGGSNLPVVYLPYIPKGTPDTAVFCQRELSLYGRITSDWTAEVVLGKEWDATSGEVVRVPGVTIEEET